MGRLNNLNIFLIAILILFIGYVLGSLTQSVFFDLLSNIYKEISKNEVFTSSVVVVIGWFMTSYLDRKLAKDQFIADKKFVIAEILLKSLSKYSESLVRSTKLITSFQINYNIPLINSKYNGSTILNDIYQEWLITSQPYIEFLQNLENYEIVLNDIKPLLDKFKEKREILNQHFQEKFLLTNKNFLNFQSNSDLKNELITLIKETQSLIWDQSAYVMDIRIGIQNKLLSKSFDNKISLRKPTIDMEVLS